MESPMPAKHEEESNVAAAPSDSVAVDTTADRSPGSRKSRPQDRMEDSQESSELTAEEPLPSPKEDSIRGRPKTLVIADDSSEPQEKGARRVSENGSVIIHSNASDSPLDISEGMQKLLIPSPHKHSSSKESLSKGAPSPSLQEAVHEAEEDPSEDFEELHIEPDASSAVNGQAEAPSAKADVSRPGVTVTPPRSPKTVTQDSDKPDGSTIASQGRSNVAEELAEAEARADEAALAASHRASSLREQLSKEGQEDGKALDTPFTEENLNAGDDGERAAEAEVDGGAKPSSPPTRPLEVSAEDIRSYEPPEYKGLVFHDGVDSVGRPVVVINADALAPGASRKDAISYMQQRLEPIVVQGPYVLVFLNSGHSMKNKISPGWLAACYRQMSYPFRKNVKFVILVRPSAGLRFMLAIMRPLVSPKAFVKVKKVPNLAAMAAATNSEVTMQHLGPCFTTSAGQGILEGEMNSSGTRSNFQMPTLSDVEMSRRD